MTSIKDILMPEFTLCHPEKKLCKKTLLELISELVADADNRIKYQDILQGLTQRERLGSTALDKGIAIPHARIKGLKNTICILITLTSPIEFNDEIDHSQHVDIIFSLLVPEQATEQHTNTLAIITEQLRKEHYRDQLRNAQTNHDLYLAAIDD